jgi:hypothetical protein
VEKRLLLLSLHRQAHPLEHRTFRTQPMAGETTPLMT